ncbi:MAG: hypothetical protein KAW41_04075 [Candidatus Diapherotrites archaeon]|nr:hypothetical protein [Candidatus Diapherotrites archaeon]
MAKKKGAEWKRSRREKQRVAAVVEKIAKEAGVETPAKGWELYTPPGLREEELKPEHMFYSLNLLPMSKAKAEKAGAIGIRSELVKSGQPAPFVITMTYHDAEERMLMSREEAKNSLPFIQEIKRQYGEKRWAYPVFYADPEDPFIKELLKNEQIEIDRERKHVNVKITTKMFNAITDKLFGRYLKAHVGVEMALRASPNTKKKRGKQWMSDQMRERHKRHAPVFKEIIWSIIDSIKESEGLALVDYTLLNKKEKGHVDIVVNGIMQNTKPSHRESLIKLVTESLRENMSPDSEAPEESARNLVAYLNSGEDAKQLRAYHAATEFEAGELLALVKKANKLQFKKERGAGS